MTDIEPYFRHLSWVRHLAHGLVFDQSRVDDVVQDTWLQLLQRPPADDSSPRGWLAAVTRNQARQSGRAESRRRAREKSAARPAESVSMDLGPEQLVQRAETERRVVDEVLGLSEPYRQCILLRYFEGLSAADIARQLEIPAATVRIRLKRALEKLRDRLDGEFGDRREWCLALLPMAHWAHLETAAPAAREAPSSAAAVILVAIVLVLGGIAYLFFDGGEERTSSSPDRARMEEPVIVSERPGAKQHPVQQPVVDSGVDTPRSGSERPTGNDDSGSASNGAPADPVRENTYGYGTTHGGRVVDRDGDGVPGVLVVWFDSSEPPPSPGKNGALGELIDRYAGKDNDPLPKEHQHLKDRRSTGVVTASDGTFSLPPRHRGGFARVYGDGLVLIRSASERSQRDHLDLLFVVARTTVLSGIVVDRGGNPVENAGVTVKVTDRDRLALPDLDGEREEFKEWGLWTDRAGAFSVGSAPEGYSVDIRVTTEGHEAVTRTVELPTAEPVRIVLRPDETLSELRGHVRDENGNNLPGAKVFRGAQTTVTDSSGEFALRMGENEELGPVLIVKHGYQIRDIGSIDRDQVLEVVLVGPALRITGRLSSSGDIPFQEVLVGLEDPTWTEDADLPLEYEASGKVVPVRPDRFGNFEIEGLADRFYQLRIWHQETLHLQVTAPIAAGTTDASIRFDRDQLIHEVTGHVTNRTGESLAGVEVRLGMVTQRYPYGHDSTSRPITVTDSDGYFVIEGVPHQDATITLRGENIVERDFEVKDPDDELRIELETRSQLSVRVDIVADSFRILDSGRVALQLSTSIVGPDGKPGLVTSNVAAIADGESATVEVSDAAAFIVFFQGGREVKRAALSLHVGANGLLDL